MIGLVMGRRWQLPRAAYTALALVPMALVLTLVAACARGVSSPVTRVERILEPLTGAPGLLPGAAMGCEADGAVGDGRGSPNALVIRVSEHCRACETQLQELVTNREQWSARGYELFVVPSEAENCAAVVRQIPRGPYVRLPARRELVAAYPADSTPTLYVLRGGQLALRLVGLASVEELLRTVADADHAEMR